MLTGRELDCAAMVDARGGASAGTARSTGSATAWAGRSSAFVPGRERVAKHGDGRPRQRLLARERAGAALHGLVAVVRRWCRWRCAIAGYFPGRRLRKVGDLPRGVMEQWRRWCLNPRVLLGAEGEAVRRRYARGAHARRVALVHRRRVHVGARTPPPARLLHGRAGDMRRIAPRDVGVRRIGHFGFFRQRFATTLWPQVTQWLAAETGIGLPCLGDIMRSVKPFFAGRRAGPPKQGPVHGLAELGRFGPSDSPQGLSEPRASPSRRVDRHTQRAGCCHEHQDSHPERRRHDRDRAAREEERHHRRHVPGDGRRAERRGRRPRGARGADHRAAGHLHRRQRSRGFPAAPAPGRRARCTGVPLHAGAGRHRPAGDRRRDRRGHRHRHDDAAALRFRLRVGRGAIGDAVHEPRPGARIRVEPDRPALARQRQGRREAAARRADPA